MAKPTTANETLWKGCPVRYAAGIFGDKWCFVLLRDVLIHGKRFYGEFAKSEEGISSNILANRLAHLEKTDMLTRHVDSQKRSRVYYLPTAKARDLLPAFLGMMMWSARHDGDGESPQSFLNAMRDDPAGTAKKYDADIDRVNAELPQALPEPAK